MHSKEEESPLHTGDGADSDSGDSLDSLDFKDLGQPPTWRARRFWFRLGGRSLSCLATILVSALAGAFLALHFLNLDQNCAAHTAQWSPLLDQVNIEYKWTPFDGNFMQENIYRQVGNDEVDKAWEALGVDARAGVISHEDGLASGLDDSFVQRNEKHGGGFMVNVEGMHHLHCLNLVRKSLYFNYERYSKMKMHAFKNDGEILRLHVTHCLDTIRQVLMCNVDTAVLGQVWVAASDDGAPLAFPDFNTRHKCKNYDDVKNWAQKLQAPPVDQVPEDYLATPKKGDILPATP